MSKRKEPRSVKINRIGKKLAARYAKQNAGKTASRRPLVRKGRRLKLSKLIAYDLETTRIEKGTPKPLYITAFCDEWKCSMRVESIPHLAMILENRFLIEENKNCRFVAWNGNNFDVYFIAAALLHTDKYILRPYLTRSKNLRGLRVSLKDDDKTSWEFLDGISMTGMTGCPLSKFLKTFAPDFLKLDAPNWETETFDFRNKKHVEYADRDSEGLYHALIKAQNIVVENFGVGLQATIGNMGIKIFQSHMPETAAVWQPSPEVMTIVRDTVMRGGYCWCVKKYQGPVWKYDINQAYAAAMRDAFLPAGRCIHSKTEHPLARTGIYRIEATHATNKIPFYYRDSNRMSVFGVKEITETWITSIELKQLRKEGWKIQVKEGYFWDEFFRMKEYVDKLEGLRMSAEDGPQGAQGTIMKMIGNNSYGKTVEQLDGLELIMANDKPEGWYDYQSEEEIFQHIFFRFGQPVMREYHQPQLGAFITAQVRMVLRRAILLKPDAWLYADTDCAMFSEPVALDIDPKKYGLWKVEDEGVDYTLITKKVYANHDASVKHAKGLNVKRLTSNDFENWLNGVPPIQTQTQRQNFVKVMTGFEMFAERTKTGQKINLTGIKKTA